MVMRRRYNDLKEPLRDGVNRANGFSIETVCFHREQMICAGIVRS
jgi:hypothetical protein